MDVSDGDAAHGAPIASGAIVAPRGDREQAWSIDMDMVWRWPRG